MDSGYCVVIPSTKRAGTLHKTVLSVLRQNVLPERIILAVTGEEDTLPETRGLPLCDVFLSPAGWACQLNAAVDRIPSGLRMVAIFDDDVELSEDYCSKALAQFAKRDDILLFDGLVLKNGNVTRNEAKELINASFADELFTETSLSHGCNMNIRRSVLDRVRFNSKMVADALYCDLDFARRVKKLGIVGRANACRCVHLSVQLARPPGMRYGFSQIANPIHLYKKGSITLGELVFFFCARSTLANVLGLLAPKGIDRKGRLRGNLIAFKLAAFGRCTPDAIGNIR